MLFQYTIAFFVSFLISHGWALDLVPISDPTKLTNGLHPGSKREASFTGDLDLQDFENFLWGGAAGDTLIYANLTVYFPETYRHVIAMERFAGKLKSVNCGEHMMLEFINKEAFEYAQRSWDWVNKDANHTFIMVTNYAGCADNLERLPFVVSKVKYDTKHLKAYLTADLKEWEEVTHSYTLNVGHMPLTPTHRLLMSRGVIPRGPDFTLNLASSYDKNLFSTSVGGWTTSVDAVIRTSGSLHVDLNVDVSWFHLKSAAMTINPRDVAASVQLALSESGTLSKEYRWQKTVISIPIEGVTIAKIVKIGAFLDVDVGFTMEEWKGKAQANLGARVALSNSAIVKVDLVNSKNNRFSGWTPTFTPIPLTLSAKVEGAAQVYAEPNIKLEASALGKGWDVGLNLKMPYIEADFAAMYESTGVCHTKKTLGVEIDAKIGVALSAQAATKGHEASPFWEKELYSHEWPLFSKCMAFGPSNAHSGEVAHPKPPSPKSKKPKTTKAPKPKTTKAPTHKTTKAPTHKTTKTPAHKTTKAPTHKTTKAPKPETTKKPKPSSTKHKHPSSKHTLSKSVSKPHSTAHHSAPKSSHLHSKSSHKPSGTHPHPKPSHKPSSTHAHPESSSEPHATSKHHKHSKSSATHHATASHKPTHHGTKTASASHSKLTHSASTLKYTTFSTVTGYHNSTRTQQPYNPGNTDEPSAPGYSVYVPASTPSDNPPAPSATETPPTYSGGNSSPTEGGGAPAPPNNTGNSAASPTYGGSDNYPHGYPHGPPSHEVSNHKPSNHEGNSCGVARH